MVRQVSNHWKRWQKEKPKKKWVLWISLKTSSWNLEAGDLEKVQTGAADDKQPMAPSNVQDDPWDKEKDGQDGGSEDYQ